MACPAQTEVQVINIASSDNLYNAALYCEETEEAKQIWSLQFSQKLRLSQFYNIKTAAAGGWWLW